jgi:hypothetical protein
MDLAIENGLLPLVRNKDEQASFPPETARRHDEVKWGTGDDHLVASPEELR